MKTIAYGTMSATGTVQKIEIERRELTARDVEISVMFCGICHSDIHTAHGDWGDVAYPCVPGHEIVGTVSAVGSEVSKHKIGDVVGVGCMVNSCGTCEQCKAGEENYCNAVVWTYASTDSIDGTDTKGGYAEKIVVTENFIIPIPAGMDPAQAAPLLCAGITMYSPLRKWGVTAGMKVGIIGVGGLGHMGIKLAAAMGAEVSAITTNVSKAEVAESYGAKHVLVSSDEAQMAEFAQYFDVLIDTAPGAHEMKPYIDLLKLDGSMVMVGPIQTTFSFVASDLMSKRRSVAGSSIGSVAETVEMLAFCAEHAIYPTIEIVQPGQIQDAWDAMMASRMDHRYVIDLRVKG